MWMVQVVPPFSNNIPMVAECMSSTILYKALRRTYATSRTERLGPGEVPGLVLKHMPHTHPLLDRLEYPPRQVFRTIGRNTTHTSSKNS